MGNHLDGTMDYAERMKRRRVGNVDTLSALLDRLIVEHIKRYSFARENKAEASAHQDDVILEIRSRLTELLADSFGNLEYEYLGEHRTFRYEDLIAKIEDLILDNIRTGEADREKLTELGTKTRNSDLMRLYELKARFSNEKRAIDKNEIDWLFNLLVESTRRADNKDA